LIKKGFGTLPLEQSFRVFFHKAVMSIHVDATLQKHLKMPTKYTHYKWLCDYCSHSNDAEVDIVMHEREMHGTGRQNGDLLQSFEEVICARLADPNILDTDICEYERICKSILEQLLQRKGGFEDAFYRMNKTSGKQGSGSRFCFF
jgi:hypothetical protein